MINRLLGIEICANAVKVVELIKTSKGVVLNKCDSARVTDSEEALVKALKEILSKKLVKTKKAVVVISGAFVTIKRITLPQMPGLELMQAVKFQVEKLISYPIEEAIFDFHPISTSISSAAYKNKKEESNEQINYAVAVAKKNLILKIMNICQKAGIKVISISAVPIALEAAFSSLLTSEISSIIYMGQYSTNISIYKEKEFVFNREIGIGGDAITKAMTGIVLSDKGRIELKAEDAETLKLKEGIPFDINEYTLKTGIPGGELYAMIRPAIEKMEAEILRSFDYFGSPVTKIILTGGSSETKGLIDIISNTLKIKTEKGNLPVQSNNSNLPLSSFSVAIGACLEEGKRINLLTEDYKHPIAGFINKIANFWTAGFIYAFVLVVLFSCFFYKNIVVSKEVSNLKAEAAKLGITLDGGKEPSKDIYAYLEKFNIPGQKDILVKIMDDFEKTIPERVSLDKIKYDSLSHSLIIMGLISGNSEKDNITSFIQNLRKNRFFSSVDLSSLRESPAARVAVYEFELKCAIAGATIK